MALTRPMFVRLLQIHQAIGQGTYPTLEGLARLCEVDPRTVKRDLKLLREEFNAPLGYSRRHAGYCYERPFSLVAAPFHEQELFALSVVIDVAHALRNTPFADAIRNALEKLRLMMPSAAPGTHAEQTGAIAYVPDPTLPEQTQAAIHFNQLLDATNSHRQVRLTYRAPSPQRESTRVVNPHLLYLHHGIWYVHGFCHLREAEREFAVHRILDLDVLPTSFVPPALDGIRQAFARRFTIVQGAAFEAHVWFDAESAPFIRERTWHASQQIADHQDGSCTLSMRVEGMQSVLTWVLSFGRHAAPLGPPELVDQVLAEARAMSVRRKIPRQ